MRLDDEVLFLHRAPANQESAPAFEQVDRSIQFAFPAARLNLPAAVIYKEQRSWMDDWIHRPVVCSNPCIPISARLRVVQKQKRKLAPALDHSAEECRAPNIHPGIEGEGKHHVTVDAGTELERIGPDDGYHARVCREIGNVDAVPLKHFQKVEPVNGAQRV